MTRSDDRIADLLLQWEESFEQGNDIPVDALCGDCPDLIPALAERIAALKRMAWVNASAINEPTKSTQFVSSPNECPKIIDGRYRLDCLIGEGGMGQVWHGFDLELHRPVAVKVPKQNHPTSSEHVEKFLAEARKMAALKHPGIVPVYDVVRHERACFIVSALIEGVDLGKRLRMAPFSLRECVRIVAEVADALDHAHQKGIIHRDIKPANILLNVSGQVCITDFGISLTRKDMNEQTDISGTLAYMSPEQQMGKNLDSRTDIYSLGVILDELLTSNRHSICTTVNVRQPVYLDLICKKCLSLKPGDRFASARELVDALRSYMVGLTTWTDWLGCSDPEQMLSHLHNFLAEPRKLRLFACACIRQNWPELTVVSRLARTISAVTSPMPQLSPVVQSEIDKVAQVFAELERVGQQTPVVESEIAQMAQVWAEFERVSQRSHVVQSEIDKCQKAVALAERYADGQATEAELRVARKRPWSESGASKLTQAAEWVVQRQVWTSALEISRLTSRNAQTAILHDIFGPEQYHPTRGDPSWVNGLTLTMAKTIYDTCAFDQMPLLAKVLEEAGCDDKEVLEHCAGSGPHFKGCWLLDLLLGSKLMSYFKQGEANRCKNDIDRAIADYTEAIRLDPTWALAYSGRGNTHLLKSEFDHAIADCTEAIRLDPTILQAHFIRGESYRLKANHGGAIADYTETIRLDPKYALAYSSRGESYLLKGDYNHAIADSTEAIRLDPTILQAHYIRGESYRLKADQFGPKTALEWFERAKSNLLRWDIDRAITDASEAIRLDPNHALAYRIRAEAYRCKNEFDQAVADVNEAIRLDPKYTPIDFTRIEAFHGMNELERTIADASEAIRLDPTNALFYSKRGFAYWERGEFSAAIVDFTEALRLNPNCEWPGSVKGGLLALLECYRSSMYPPVTKH